MNEFYVQLRKYSLTTVSREAYKALEKAKKNGETFNDVVADMVAKQHNRDRDAIEEEEEWLASNPGELAKYQAQYIAIWKKQIIGFGNTGHEARKMALKKMPDSNPTIMGVPPKEGFIGGGF